MTCSFGGGLKDQRPRAAGRAWLGSALLSAQVALSLVLLTGAGLFVRTLQKASAVDVGFDAARVFMVQFDLELMGYSNDAAREFYRRVTERLGAVPGVEAVSRASAPPVDRGFWGAREILLDGGSSPSGGRRVQVEHNEVARSISGPWASAWRAGATSPPLTRGPRRASP